MLRDLATLLENLQSGITATGSLDRSPSPGLQVREVTMNLPLDIVPIFRDGGCALLADVARTTADADWYTQRSQLSITWRAHLVEEDER